MATLLELRTQARQKADMEDTTYITDTELNVYINSGIKELYDLLLTTYGDDYYLQEYAFSTVSGTAGYALPSGFYKLRGLDAQINGSTWSTLKKFQFNDRNKYQEGSQQVFGVNGLRYRLTPTQVKFAPTPSGVISMNMWYAPTFTDLSADGDTFDGINGWEEYATVDAAIQMLTKEESDPSALMKRKADLLRRIVETAPRDTGSPDTIQEYDSVDGATYLYGYSD